MGWFNERWARVWGGRRARPKAGAWTLNPVFGIREKAPRAGRLDCRPVCYVWGRGGMKGWFLRVPL